MVKIIAEILILSALYTGLAAQKTPDILRSESAPGARAAMGLFSHASSRALINELFLVKHHSWEESLGSLALAALSYQVISYHTTEGVELNPFKLNKEWNGFWPGYLAGEGLDWFLYGVEASEEAQLIIASSLILATSVVVITGEVHEGFRKADDGPLTIKNLLTNRDSYWVHFSGSGGLYWAISNHSSSPERSLLFTTGLIWLWEVKDAYIRWEDSGFIGGDGFSWRDGTAGTIAAGGSYVFDKWLLPWIRQNIFRNLSVNLSGNHRTMQMDFRIFY